MARERLLYEDDVRYDGQVPYANRVWNVCGELIKFPLQGVHRFEWLRLSDMSNRFFAAIST
jgi:hypothetical protein